MLKTHQGKFTESTTIQQEIKTASPVPPLATAVPKPTRKAQANDNEITIEQKTQSPERRQPPEPENNPTIINKYPPPDLMLQSDQRFNQTMPNFGKIVPAKSSPRQMMGLTAIATQKATSPIRKPDFKRQQQMDGGIRGANNPKRWRASYDTNEINDIITMQSSSPRLTQTKELMDDRFDTTNKNFYTDKKLEAKQRIFGADEQRNMRYALDICDPAYLSQDARFNIAAEQLKRQKAHFQQDTSTLKDRIMRETNSGNDIRGTTHLLQQQDSQTSTSRSPPRQKNFNRQVKEQTKAYQIKLNSQFKDFFGSENERKEMERRAHMVTTNRYNNDENPYNRGVAINNTFVTNLQGAPEAKGSDRVRRLGLSIEDRQKHRSTTNRKTTIQTIVSTDLSIEKQILASS